MNVEIGTEAVQFLSWEHINGIFFAVQSSIAWPKRNLHFARWTIVMAMWKEIFFRAFFCYSSSVLKKTIFSDMCLFIHNPSNT